VILKEMQPGNMTATGKNAAMKKLPRSFQGKIICVAMGENAAMGFNDAKYFFERVSNRENALTN